MRRSASPAPSEHLVVQHGDLVRHQHELAVVLARPHARLHGAADRPRGAELRVGRGRHRRRRRPRPRLLAARRTGTIGNFWVDLTRGTLRILLPFSSVIAHRADRGRSGPELRRLPGGRDAHRRDRSRSPAARSRPRRRSRILGTNGGGFYNANSAHPFENPTPWTNLLADLPAAASSRSASPAPSASWSATLRQGYAILATMWHSFVASLDR